jgi:hypothetical protein
MNVPVINLLLLHRKLTNARKNYQPTLVVHFYPYRLCGQCPVLLPGHPDQQDES